MSCSFYAHDALVVSLHLVRLPSCWGFDSSKMALTRGQKSQDTQPVYYYAWKAKKSSPMVKPRNTWNYETTDTTRPMKPWLYDTIIIWQRHWHILISINCLLSVVFTVRCNPYNHLYNSCSKCLITKICSRVCLRVLLSCSFDLGRGQQVPSVTRAPVERRDKFQ